MAIKYGKIIALLLTASMLATLLPVLPVFAAEQAAEIELVVPSLKDGVQETYTARRTATTELVGAAENGIATPPANSVPIANRAQLEAINKNLSGTYHLTADIDLSGYEWQPIGRPNDSFSGDTTFTGTFDGQGHVIKNLTMTTPGISQAGLFAGGYGATFKNIGMVGTKIIATNSRGFFGFAGAICGYAFSGTKIINCYNTGDIKCIGVTASAHAGGLCGEMITGTISNCYNSGNITADSKLNKGELHNYAQAGGIVGVIANEGTMSNCYNTGKVTAVSEAYTTLAGGISAENMYFNVSNCYSSGDVSASSKLVFRGSVGVGSICAYFWNVKGYGGYKNVYWNSDSKQSLNDVELADSAKKGISNCTDYAKPLTENQMKLSSSFTGFDFKNVWSIAQNINQGYPYLNALAKPIPLNADYISSINVEGYDIGFKPEIDYYEVDLPPGTKKAPLITTTTLDYEQNRTVKIDIVYPKTLPGAATVTCTVKMLNTCDTAQKKYTIQFNTKVLPQLADVTSNVATGIVQKGTLVSLSSEDPDAAIYYFACDPQYLFLDITGLPGDYMLYTAPIEINKDTTIIAYAAKEGAINSNLAYFAYEVSKEEPIDADIIVGSDAARAGEMVDIPVTLVSKPGVAQLGLKLNFDNSILVPVSITVGNMPGVFASNIPIGPGFFLPKLTYTKVNMTNDSDFVDTGILFTVRFKVLDDASFDETLLNITYEQGDVLNENNESVDLKTLQGTITSYIYGDVYKDGVINAKDILKLTQYIAQQKNVTLSLAEYKAAKVCGQDKVSIIDALKLAQYLAEWKGLILGESQ